jgi:hypothetical protein
MADRTDTEAQERPRMVERDAINAGAQADG